MAQEPDIELVPGSLAFPPTAFGTSVDLACDIRNIGDADLQVRSLEFMGLNKTAYRLLSPSSLPFMVPALTGSRMVTVHFTPTSSRSYDYAWLAVGSNDPDEPVVELALGGAAQ